MKITATFLLCPLLFTAALAATPPDEYHVYPEDETGHDIEALA